LGVDAGVSEETAPATAQVVAQPTAPSKINLDESPEFHKWKAEYDRKLRDQEQNYQAMLARQAQELKQRTIAEMDDYQRLEYELNETRQREQSAYQRLQEIEVEQAKMRVLREVSTEMGVPVEAIADAADVADAWRLAAIKQRELQQQREQSRQAEENRRVAERAGKYEANRVDLGSGSPVPTNDWERTYLAAKGRKDSRSLFKLALGEQQE